MVDLRFRLPTHQTRVIGFRFSGCLSPLATLHLRHMARGCPGPYSMGRWPDYRWRTNYFSPDL